MRIFLSGLLLSLIGWQLPVLFADNTNDLHVQQVAYLRSAEAPEPIVSGRPARVIIPSLGLDVPVVDGHYDAANHTWTLNKASAQFAVNTPLLNDTAGNTFIYGHNNAAVFSKLLSIQPGSEVIVLSETGQRFSYVFRSSVDVHPHAVEALKYSGPPKLTIQTCAGQYYEHRRLFHFDFTGVSD